MKKEIVSVPALETGAPYNLCVRYGRLVFVSGMPPFDEDFSRQLREARANGAQTPTLPSMTFEQQVRIVMNNIKSILNAAGSNLDCLLKAMVWLSDLKNQAAFDRIYASYFTSPQVMPTRTRLQAGRLPMDCDVEIEVIAHVAGEGP